MMLGLGPGPSGGGGEQPFQYCFFQVLSSDRQVYYVDVSDPTGLGFAALLNITTVPFLNTGGRIVNMWRAGPNHLGLVYMISTSASVCGAIILDISNISNPVSTGDPVTLLNSTISPGANNLSISPIAVAPDTESGIRWAVITGNELNRMWSIVWDTSTYEITLTSEYGGSSSTKDDPRWGDFSEDGRLFFYVEEDDGQCSLVAINANGTMGAYLSGEGSTSVIRTPSALVYEYPPAGGSSIRGRALVFSDFYSRIRSFECDESAQALGDAGNVFTGINGPAALALDRINRRLLIVEGNAYYNVADLATGNLGTKYLVSSNEPITATFDPVSEYFWWIYSDKSIGFGASIRNCQSGNSVVGTIRDISNNGNVWMGCFV